jgi:hypothetical protein
MVERRKRTFTVTISVDEEIVPELLTALGGLASDLRKEATRQPTRTQDPNTKRPVITKLSRTISEAARAGRYEEES